MPFHPLRTRSGIKALAIVVLITGFLSLPIGCELFHSDRQPEPKPLISGNEGKELVARAAPPPTPPGKYHIRRGYYVFYYDFEDLDKNDDLFPNLDSLPDQVFGELKLPPSNTVVQVFLFDTQEHYERFMGQKYKDLPPRRAYFLQGPDEKLGGKDELRIYTYMGNHLHTDLRHELTHALLHGVLKEVPLWLDEGLAGYFELPPACEGVNPQHLEKLCQGPFQPDLVRLEKLDKVRQMGKKEYAEAWAWVHYMLRGEAAAKKVLLNYLQALRTNPNPGLLLPQLREGVLDPEQAIVEHVEKLEQSSSQGQGKKVKGVAPDVIK
jgi:hypothetical protein